MNSLSKKLAKQHITFHFIDSPVVYNGQDKEEGKDFRQWWSATKENVLTLDRYDTLTESLDYLCKIWNEGKYDGLLGFSQGSILAQIFAWKIQNGTISTYTPKFLMLCSSIPISDTQHKTLYDTKLSVPTLMMTGESDLFVSPSLTDTIANNITECIVVRHTGGHYVSTTKDTTDAIIKFLGRFTT